MISWLKKIANPGDDIELKRKIRFWFIVIGTLLTIGAPLLMTQFSVIPFTNYGQIGDTIGGITAPFVGIMGAILVYYALKEQIEANKLINDQFLDQKKTTIQQNFEQTFFNMLNIHHEIVNNIRFSNTDWNLSIRFDPTKLSNSSLDQNRKIALVGRINGFTNRNFNPSRNEMNYDSRSFFEYTVGVMEDLINCLDSPQVLDLVQSHYSTSHKIKESDEEIITSFDSVYKVTFSQLSSNLGHYYRNLYRIVKMISEQKFGETEEKSIYEKQYFYTSIVRSQLSDYEIKWLFYNGLFDYGAKFKPLIEEYTLLKILDGNDSQTIKKLKPLYDERAFIKRHWKKERVIVIK